MHFHKGILLGAILLASMAPKFADAQFQAPTKEELEMTSDPLAPGAPAVYLYREEREDDPHHFRSVYARIKVLTEAGKEAATVSVVYHKNFMFYAGGDNSSRMANGFATSWDAPDISHAGEDTRIDTNATGGHAEVSAIEGRVIHADGTVIPLTGTPADLLKVKNGNDQLNQMTFTLPGAEVGSIIEYRYQVRYDRFQSAPEWQVQQPYFVHKAHYVFIPAEQFAPNRNLGGSSGGVSDASIIGAHGEVMTDVRSADVLPPGKVVKQDGLGNWFVDLTDIPAIPHELYAPPMAAQIYQVDFFYTFTPDAKEFWQKEMALWMKDINDYTAPTSLIKSTAEEATAGATSPLDKAKRLYALVEKLENRDFAGNGSPFVATDFVPRGSVEGVLEKKSGNGEELALLYLSLARAAGLDARPERITSRNRSAFNAQMQDTSQLDAVVIGLTIDGKEVVVDPGQKMAPFSTLHWAHAGAGGLRTPHGLAEPALYGYLWQGFLQRISRHARRRRQGAFADPVPADAFHPVAVDWPRIGADRGAGGRPAAAAELVCGIRRSLGLGDAGARLRYPAQCARMDHFDCRRSRRGVRRGVPDARDHHAGGERVRR